MINNSPKKVDMPVQDPNIRNNNFLEVALGYTEEMAIEEARRCLNCKHKPCVNGCPVKVNIPEFIQEIAKGDFKKAYDIIKGTNALPAVCGRVCPQESQCEKLCVRGIKQESVAIGRLERFVADYNREHDTASSINIEKNNIKTAIVGGGPAGLSCAGELVKLGYDVTVYEALHTVGGVLMYGIPEFRLPKSVVSYEVEGLRKLGVKFETNTIIGATLTIEDLFEMGNKAIFIGSGAGLPNFMKIEGENLKGVYSANEFLTRVNLMKAYQEDSDTPIMKPNHAVVVGGGNVAMDAARSVKRLGCKHVSIVYRRSMDELPARLEEIHHAIEEGIEFNVLTNPVKILGDKGWVTGIECVRMELGEPDSSGRRSPIEVKDSNFVIETDCVIMAIGTSPNPLIRNTTEGLITNKRGCFSVNEDGLTSLEGIYAGGDAVTGAATVILAMGAGKSCAKAMDEYIKGQAK